MDYINTIRAKAICLRTEQQVEAALDAMAVAITERLKETNPLVLCVMTGAVVFTGQLLPRLAFPLELDYYNSWH